MTIVSRRISFILDTTKSSGQTQVVAHTLGVVPKAIFFATCGVGEPDLERGTAFECFGVATGTTEADNISGCGQDKDAQSSARAAHSVRDSSSVHFVRRNGSTSIIGASFVSAWTASDFTLECNAGYDDSEFPTTLRVMCLILGGDEIADAQCGGANITSGTGLMSVGGHTFTTAPANNQSLLVMLGHPGNGPTSGADLNLTHGFATAPGEQFTVTVGSDNGANTMKTRRYLYEGEVYGTMDNSIGNVRNRLAFNNWETDGFTLNKLERNDNRFFAYAILTGVDLDVHVGSLLTQTTTAVQSYTAAGFTPGAGLFMSHMTTESTQDTVQDHEAISYGFASNDDPIRQASVGQYALNGVVTSEVYRSFEISSVYRRFASATEDGEFELDSWTANGFDWHHSNADPDQADVGVVLLGPGEVVVPPGVQPTRFYNTLLAGGA